MPSRTSMLRLLTLLLAVAHLALSTSVRAEVFSAGVSGTANIFGSGHAVAPGPDGNGGGTLPPTITLPSGANRILRVVSTSGQVRYSGSLPLGGPDGVAWSLNGLDYGGLAGPRLPFARVLLGVFLDGTEPADPAPAPLTLNAMDFRSIAPGLRQIFPLGDGLTSTAVGDTQLFVVPSTATRACFGFTDSFGGVLPGWFGDNSGQISLQVSVVAGQVLGVGEGDVRAFTVGPALGNARDGGIRLLYTLPRDADVRAEVLDVAGRVVGTLSGPAHESAGAHERRWDGRDRSGARVASGLYFARVVSSAGRGTVKLVVP